ncbi:MAG: hypothetical protein QOF51_788 [Chloroflexota bacterium]|nr:hypothetical protein [Chloroflexota bacterium]
MTGSPAALARGYFALLSGGPVESAREILAEGFVFHHPPLTPSEGWIGRDTFLARALTVTRAGFPDMRFEVADVIAEGDRAAVRWVMHATHLGPYLGVPASGRRIEVSGMNFFQVEAGRIAITWAVRDTLGLLRQIGGVEA